MGVRQTIISSLTTASALFGVALIYVLVIHLWAKVPWRDAWKRTGLTVGARRWWLISAALLLPELAYVWLSFQWLPVTADDVHSPYRVFLGQGLNLNTLAVAFAYGVVSAGFGEELLFRGLIGGVLSRRMKAWRANVIQALIFLAPHLLMLFVTPKAWLLLPGVLGLALLAGWLRIRSGSIGPGLVLHGLGNTFVGILAATHS